MNNFPGEPVRGDDSESESSPDSDNSSRSANSYTSSDRDGDFDSDLSLSADDEDDSDSDEEGAEGIFVSYTIDHERDPNIGSAFEHYKIVARNQASCLFRVRTPRDPGTEYTASVIENDGMPDYLRKYEKIKHLNVNKIHDVAAGPEKSLIVYKPTHRNLHEYVCANKPLPEVEVAELFQQILKIIADIHRIGFVVPDLKVRKFVFIDPESKKLVLETWEDSILLADPKDDAILLKSRCPTYASPELIICRELKYSGKKADCWSLGVILYALLANRYPFFHLNIDGMFAKIRQGKYRQPEYRSPLACALVRALLNVDYKTRLSAEEALKHEWLRIFCNPDYPIHPPARMSFGNLTLPGIPQERDEDSYNRPDDSDNEQHESIDLHSPSTSGYNLRDTTQQHVIEPEEPNIDSYPVYSPSHCLSPVIEAGVDTSASFIAPQLHRQQSSSNSIRRP